METSESRKFLKRVPETESLVRRILTTYNIDYDNEEIYSWEIRSVKQPSEDSFTGTITVYKLYIDNDFIINVLPLTPELLQIINEQYPVLKAESTNNEIIAKELISVIRNRKDPKIAFPFSDDSNELAILKIVATEEGAVSMERITEGLLKGLFIITFNGLYTNPLPLQPQEQAQVPEIQ